MALGEIYVTSPFLGMGNADCKDLHVPERTPTVVRLAAADSANGAICRPIWGVTVFVRAAMAAVSSSAIHLASARPFVPTGSESKAKRLSIAEALAPRAGKAVNRADP